MTKLVAIPLYEFTDILQENEWYDSLISCPSQCYYHVVDDFLHYILYLRWRYNDPWHAYIITGASNEKTMSDSHAHWSEDLFEVHSVNLKEDQVDLAKDTLFAMFSKYRSKEMKDKRNA